MVRRLRRTLVTLGLLLGVAAPAEAQFQRTFKLTSTGNFGAFGWMLAPYPGKVLDANIDVTFNCVDWFHWVTEGQVWKADVTRLDGATSLSKTRFGALPNALDLYRQAAWLSTQLMSTDHYDTKVDISTAMWALFPQNEGAPELPNTSKWLELAATNHTSLDYSTFWVVTDVRKTEEWGSQEFIVQATDMPVPGALLMVAGGLVGLVPSVRRRREHGAVDA